MRGRNWGCDFGLRFMEGSLRSFSSGVLFSATLLICVGPLAGQVSSSGQGAVPVYKANARAVVVDVVVTRGNDEPVPALQKQEFKVLEDGKPQTIDFFEEHTAKALPSGALAPLPKMRKMIWPPTAKLVSTMKQVRAPLRAMRLRRAGSAPSVMARNEGMAAKGSTRKKMELSASTEKRTSGAVRIC